MVRYGSPLNNIEAIVHHADFQYRLELNFSTSRFLYDVYFTFSKRYLLFFIERRKYSLDATGPYQMVSLISVGWTKTSSPRCPSY